MTRTATTTAAALAALAWLPPAIPAAAQETTTEEALEYLRQEELPYAAQLRWSSPRQPAVHILRQASGPRPAVEIDAFADQVAATMADATLPEHVRRNAKNALLVAADTDEPHLGGTPYPRAFELLVRVYEGGTYDHALHTIMRVDSVRGPAYVRELFERSERPLLCRWRYSEERGWTPLHETVGGPPFDGAACEGYPYWDAGGTPWCRAGGHLFGDVVADARERSGGDRDSIIRIAGQPSPFPPGLPEHVADWHRRCL